MLNNATFIRVRTVCKDLITLMRKKYTFFLKKKISCDISVYTMELADLTVSIFMENPIGLKRDKQLK